MPVCHSDIAIAGADAVVENSCRGDCGRGTNHDGSAIEEFSPGFAADPALIIVLSLIANIISPPAAHLMAEAGAFTTRLPATLTLEAWLVLVASQYPIPISEGPFAGALGEDSESYSIELFG